MELHNHWTGFVSTSFSGTYHSHYVHQLIWTVSQLLLASEEVVAFSLIFNWRQLLDAAGNLFSLLAHHNKTPFHIVIWQVVIMQIWFPAALRIQFSSPPLFLGGPGMLSRTRWAPCDLLTTTSFSLTAVCIRRTFDWFLVGKQGQSETQYKENINDHT